MITPIEKSIQYFEKAKETAPSVRDLVYLDGVLAILDTVKVYEDNFLNHLKLKYMNTIAEQKTIEQVLSFSDNLLNKYKEAVRNNITEHPCDNEKEELEKLDKEIEDYKKELRKILNPDGKLYNADFKKYYDTKLKRNIWVLGYFGGGSVNVMDAYQVASDYSNSTNVPIGTVKFDEILNSRRYKGFKFVFSETEQEPEKDSQIMADNVMAFLMD